MAQPCDGVSRLFFPFPCVAAVRWLCALAGVAVSAFAADTDATPTSLPALLPRPTELVRTSGAFTLNAGTAIVADSGAAATARYLADRLAPATGFALAVTTLTGSGAAPAPGSDRIELATDAKLTRCGAEGYELEVTPAHVTLRAPTDTGLFYGVQTLLQLLPPTVFGAAPDRGTAWTIPAVRIADQPRFPWRGTMVDVSRHFFTVAEIERVLDEMAMHKLNTLHWHLVDNEGWRIEIKKYPRLTEVGGWRDGIGWDLDPKASQTYRADGKYGGFYTQEEIRAVVAYAAARHITVVPEIEMPGHSLAAIRAYAELACPSTPAPAGKAARQSNVFCAGQDRTFEFLQDVLTEVFALFPSPYVHIGGDEVNKTFWHACPRCQARMQQEGLKDEHELQSYFIRRIEKFVNAHGHRLIGWTEIAQGGLASSAVVMDWIGGGPEAASAGHEVVMARTWYCYYNYLQVPNPTGELRPLNRFVPLNRVYAFEPVPENLPADKARLILGAQCCLWAEYIPNLAKLEYQAFPRLCALSEVLWSPKAPRDWADFMGRLRVHAQRLDAAGIKYFRGSVETMEPDPFAPWPPPVSALPSS